MSELSDRQEHAILSVLDTDARVHLLDGAVRSGKTLSSLMALVAQIRRAPIGANVLLVGRTTSTIGRNVLAPLQDLNIFGDIAGTVSYTEGADTATILGRRVWLLGSHNVEREKVLRGMTLWLAYVDELTLISHEFFNQLFARLSMPGAKMIATTNPDSFGHWAVSSIIDKAAEGDSDYDRHPFRLADNPSLTQGYIQALRNQYTGLWARRMIDGEWCLSEGVVYSMWDPSRHVVSDVDPQRLGVRTLVDGMDYGTTNPSRAVRLGLRADGHLVATAEWSHDDAMSSDWEQSSSYGRWRRNVDVHGTPDWVALDPSAASMRLQMASDGWPVTPAHSDVVRGIKLVASLLSAGRLLIHESCDQLTTEMTRYSWDSAASEKGEDKPIKLYDHSLDALRYAVLTMHSEWADWVPLVAAGAPDPLYSSASAM